MGDDAHNLRRLFETVSLRAPENAVGFVLWRIVQRYQREMDRSLQSLDLTNLQFVTLALAAWLSQAGEPVNQTAIARFGGIHPMQLSQMLKILETKGFICRKRSDHDTRAKEITMTSGGLKVLRRAFPRAIEIQHRLFGEAGHPGGKLLATLQKLDRSQAEAEQAE